MQLNTHAMYAYIPTLTHGDTPYKSSKILTTTDHVSQPPYCSVHFHNFADFVYIHFGHDNCSTSIQIMANMFLYVMTHQFHGNFLHSGPICHI